MLRMWQKAYCEGIRKLRDKIKLDYCNKNNIPLLRIHYKDYKNIPNILEGFINTL